MSGSRKMIAALCLGLAVVFAAGCYYAPPPGVAYQSAFDRSWSAVLGAFADEGVQVVEQNRGAGVITGTRGGVNVSANVRTQADGTVRVEFGAGGNVAADPALNDRIFQSYQRRMGR